MEILNSCLKRFYINYFCYYYNKLTKTHIQENRNNISGRYYHIYDLINDIIKLEYIIKGKKYILCVSRTNKKNIFKCYLNTIKNYSDSEIIEHIVIDATLKNNSDEEIDITDKINQYLGIKGNHLNHSKIKIKWILSMNEIQKFKKITILTNTFDEINYTNIEDTIYI